MNIFPYIPGYTHFIYDEGRELAFVMLVGFLIAFIAARGYTRAARIWGWKSASFGGVHTHHLVFGIVITLVASALEFSINPDPGLFQLFLAASFGVGAALILDEFALVLYLQDVYWEKQGRKSVDAIIIALTLGFLLLLHTGPFGSSQDLPHAVITTAQIINMVFVLVAAVKGKVYLAGFGVFIPLASIIGALRIGEPGSIWARWFYRKNGNKMKKSIKRYAEYEKVWRPRKEYLIDLIGGKISHPLPK